MLTASAPPSYGNKALARSVAAYPTPEAVMICSSKDSTSDRAAITEATT